MAQFDDWLSHHGIKGMRWGVRRTAEELGHVTESAGKIASTASERAKRRNRGVSPEVKKMSDEELRSRLNRINMERQYSDLTRKDTSKGFDTAKDVLAIAGSILAITVSGINIYSALRYGENKRK